MINGKSTFSWNVPAILDGDPKKFATVLLDAGFEGVALKCADGRYVHKMKSYSPWPEWGENIKPELMEALRDAGLLVYFWHFVYGYNPGGELAIAIAQSQDFKPDGYIWNAEGSFDSKPNAVSNAELLTSGLKHAFPDMPQALCWWALPKSPDTGTEWHPIKVAEAFLKVVDSAMPMMYWQGSTSTDAVSYLHKSLAIWRSFTDIPLCPIGRSYNGDGGEATPAGITAFAKSVLNMAETENLIGNSWYSMDKGFATSSWWAALKATSKWELEPPPPPLAAQVAANTLMLADHERRLKLLEKEEPEPPIPDPIDPPAKWPYTASINLDGHDKDYTVAWAITNLNNNVPVIETNVWVETNDPKYKFFDNEKVDVLPTKVTSDGGQKWFELSKTREDDWAYERLFIKKEHAMKNW